MCTLCGPGQTTSLQTEKHSSRASSKKDEKIEKKKEKRKRKAKNEPDPGKPGASAPLNHDHTHFVLVDSGARTKWGSELHLRAEFEAAYARMLHIPVATLCVQGGPGTVQGLYAS